MKRWWWYALTGLLLTLVAAGAALALVGAGQRAGVWFAAGLAYLLQLLAFGLMRAWRDDPGKFLVAWVVGIALRFGALGGVAFWLARSSALPREVTLISLVVFMVLLLFLEPVFLRGSGERRPVGGDRRGGAGVGSSEGLSER